MTLSEQQRRIAQALLKQFVDSGKSLTNQGIAYPSYRDLDKARTEALPELRKFLDRFLKGDLDLQGFKQENNALSIKHNYWDFTGFSGQMTLNQLTNWSHGSEAMAQLLREALAIPDSKEKAVEKINLVRNSLTSWPGYESALRSSENGQDLLYRRSGSQECELMIEGIGRDKISVLATNVLR